MQGEDSDLLESSVITFDVAFTTKLSLRYGESEDSFFFSL